MNAVSEFWKRLSDIKVKNKGHDEYHSYELFHLHLMFDRHEHRNLSDATTNKSHTRGGHPAAREPHVALALASCGSYTHIEVCISYICLLDLSSARYCCAREMYGGDDHVSP